MEDFFMQQIQLDRPYRYEDFIIDTQYFEEQYPDWLKVYRLGESQDGRDIIVYQLGVGEIPIVITAGVHARETINTVVLMRIIETYLQLAQNQEPLVVDYALSERILIQNPSFIQEEEDERFVCACKGEGIPVKYYPELYLKQFTFYIIPLLNPDGYEIALGGFNTIRSPEIRERAKGMNIAAEDWKGNARGIDLNRNFPSVTWLQKFPGDYPGSEKESKALMDLFAEVPAAGYLDLHSRGKSIYYHKGVMPLSYNQNQRQIANRLKEVTGYDLMPPETEIEASDSGGNTVHYFSEHYNRPAITIETVLEEAFFPLDVRYQSSTFEEIVLAPLEFVTAILEQYV